MFWISLEWEFPNTIVLPSGIDDYSWNEAVLCTVSHLIVSLSYMWYVPILSPQVETTDNIPNLCQPFSSSILWSRAQNGFQPVDQNILGIRSLSQGFHIRYPAYQMLTLQFITAANYSSEVTMKIMLWLSRIKGCRMRKIENHCSRGPCVHKLYMLHSNFQRDGVRNQDSVELICSWRWSHWVFIDGHIKKASKNSLVTLRCIWRVAYMCKEGILTSSASTLILDFILEISVNEQSVFIS